MFRSSFVALVLLPGCIGLTPTAPGPAGEETPGMLRQPDRGALVGPPGDSGGPDGDSGSGGNGGDDTGGEPGGGDTSGPGEGESPLAGVTFWVDPDTNAAREAEDADADDAALFRKIADNPVAKWLGGWNSDVEADVRDAVDAAEADGAIRAFVVYNLPNRDCGGYSAGGAEDAAAYEEWIDAIASGLGGRLAVVVLEPDGLSMTDCLSSSEADTRFGLLAYATATLQGAGALVYLDAGHSAWHPADTMAERLIAADVASADGFALNTSNYETTEDIVAYGEEVSALTGGAHFLGDTSRNGLGPTSDHEWCNPDGRALGDRPTTETGNPLVDALLWVKAPGESDGSCNGGPNAGEWWPEYALGLAERAAW